MFQGCPNAHILPTRVHHLYIINYNIPVEKR